MFSGVIHQFPPSFDYVALSRLACTMALILSTTYLNPLLHLMIGMVFKKTKTNHVDHQKCPSKSNSVSSEEQHSRSG